MSFSPYHKTPLFNVLQGYIFLKRKEKKNLTYFPVLQMGKLRLRETGSELIPQTLALEFLPSPLLRV